MAACVVHAGGSDGGIQAHIKACAALGAICSSVVTAYNTIVVQGVSVTLKPWLPERIKAIGDTSKFCAIMQRSAIDEKRFNLFMTKVSMRKCCNSHIT
ncbi:probable thiamine biosynthetic bifunctional enzyme, chloroplastic [Oryza glaberrima]|uniref:probable thiamine biosynthetic bifunctional enzyme, chloroplastic n=1 Tax=Oryza glaberrima TaxID=4538 RepID=UPI00224C0F81|nr:probable thiamine biosynthetic bifunctional enzyme, chloroplastic [Oryza glaberrima]XP_052138804.1 probable thiamine biosynthetic bifunctional enzyme, chloroplastic [Oryza glaberrima]